MVVDILDVLSMKNSVKYEIFKVESIQLRDKELGHKLCY